MLELVQLDRSIQLDIRYARSDNFVGRPVYVEARAFLQRPAADALVRVHQRIRSDGFGLTIFDAYRPWSVTKLFWDFVTEEQRPYVADPESGSRHNRGCAVDLTLHRIADGNQVPMPSEFDEFNERSHRDYRGATLEERTHRRFLRRAMEAEGFAVNPKEWWHFDHSDWEQYPILDVPFSELNRLARSR